MFAAVAPRIKEATTIVVAKSWGGSSPPKQRQRGQHLFQRLFKRLGNFDAVQAGEYGGMKKEIEGVHVVIRGLLKVKSVEPDLARCFLQNNLPTQPLPSLRRGELRA